MQAAEFGQWIGREPTPVTRGTEYVHADATVERLYLEFGARLIGLARTLTLDVQAGDDLVQDVFTHLLAVCRKRPGYVQEPAWPLLRTMLLRRAAQRRRAVVREVNRLARLRQVPIPSVWDDVDRDLAGALRSLPMRMRTCVVLHYLEDLSTADVAQAMGIERGTVTAQLAVARKQLRRFFDESHTDTSRAKKEAVGHG